MVRMNRGLCSVFPPGNSILGLFYHQEGKQVGKKIKSLTLSLIYENRFFCAVDVLSRPWPCKCSSSHSSNLLLKSPCLAKKACNCSIIVFPLSFAVSAGVLKSSSRIQDTVGVNVLFGRRPVSKGNILCLTLENCLTPLEPLVVIGLPCYLPSYPGDHKIALFVKRFSKFDSLAWWWYFECLTRFWKLYRATLLIALS